MLEPSLVRHGRVHGRYFRENFAQGGIDLVQIIPELVTNADSAIALGGRPVGRIVLRFGPPDPGFAAEWKRAMRRLRAPALVDWRYEVRCSDDGIGLDAAAVDSRLGSLGVLPDARGQRGLFGRGLRDVWLAQGGGRLEGVRDGRRVESWFFPSGGDDPYAYVHVRDEPAPAGEPAGTRITVPLAAGRPPANARLRRLVGQLVQLRPVLADPARQLWLELPGEGAQLVTLPAPVADAERPVLFDDEVEVTAGVRARVIVRRAAEPIPLSPSRATRLGGLVIRSGRAAHETTLAGHEGEPGTRHLYAAVLATRVRRSRRWRSRRFRWRPAQPATWQRFAPKPGLNCLTAASSSRLGTRVRAACWRSTSGWPRRPLDPSPKTDLQRASPLLGARLDRRGDRFEARDAIDHVRNMLVCYAHEDDPGAQRSG